MATERARGDLDVADGAATSAIVSWTGGPFTLTAVGTYDSGTVTLYWDPRNADMSNEVPYGGTSTFTANGTATGAGGRGNYRAKIAGHGGTANVQVTMSHI